MAVAHDASATHLFWRYVQAPSLSLRTIQRTHLINLQTIGSNDPNTVFIRVDGAYPNLTSTFGAMYVL
jgi:hypothetical protein